jgi:hypothetical protein
MSNPQLLLHLYANIHGKEMDIVMILTTLPNAITIMEIAVVIMSSPVIALCVNV